MNRIPIANEIPSSDAIQESLIRGSHRLVSSAMPLELKNVQLIGGELAMAWSDGEESYLPLERFRRACPCASCGGEPDVLGNISRPNVSYTASRFELVGWQLIGGFRPPPPPGGGPQ